MARIRCQTSSTPESAGMTQIITKIQDFLSPPGARETLTRVRVFRKRRTRPGPCRPIGFRRSPTQHGRRPDIPGSMC
jgi:hypothetical protein